MRCTLVMSFLFCHKDTKAQRNNRKGRKEEPAKSAKKDLVIKADSIAV
jgi:hypothetical protein